MLVNGTGIGPAIAAVEMPIGLTHIDSGFCWCDPVAEVDDNGQQVVVHREVTWN